MSTVRHLARHLRLLPLVVIAGMAGGLAACQADPQHAVPEAYHAEEAKAQNERGVALYAEAQYDEAESVLRDAVRLDPNLGPAHNNLGSVYLKRKKLYEAAWEFKIASKLMPGLAEPVGNLGQVYEAAGRLDEAQSAYAEARALAPANRGILGDLARVQVRRRVNTPELRSLLQDIALNDPRPEWRAWAQGEAVRMAAQP